MEFLYAKRKDYYIAILALTSLLSSCGQESEPVEKNSQDYQVESPFVPIGIRGSKIDENETLQGQICDGDDCNIENIKL